MNYAENVDKDFIELVLESALWKKNGVVVNREAAVNEASNEGAMEVIPELEGDIMNAYEEPQDIDELDSEREEDNFSLEDLEYVLNNMEDDDLMEHAASMLSVFDQAENALVEDEDVEEEEEDVEEEEEEDSLMSEAILSLLEAQKRKRLSKKS